MESVCSLGVASTFKSLFSHRELIPAGFLARLETLATRARQKSVPGDIERILAGCWLPARKEVSAALPGLEEATVTTGLRRIVASLGVSWRISLGTLP